MLTRKGNGSLRAERIFAGSLKRITLHNQPLSSIHLSANFHESKYYMMSIYRVFKIGLILTILMTGCGRRPKEQKPMKIQDISLHAQQPMIAMFPELLKYVSLLDSAIHQISDERRATLEKLAGYISDHLKKGQPVNLSFICTHNSRRSHFAQIWAQTAAGYFGFGNQVNTFSGGTEVTAFNPRAVAAIQRAGFQVEKTDPEVENPLYYVQYSSDAPAIVCFSKKYDHPENPAANFAAVMTCSDADEACPVIPGANFRVSLPYDDPKVADNTERESQVYDARCRQIASEMFYLFWHVNNLVSIP